MTFAVPAESGQPRVPSEHAAARGALGRSSQQARTRLGLSTAKPSLHTHTHPPLNGPGVASYGVARGRFYPKWEGSE